MSKATALLQKRNLIRQKKRTMQKEKIEKAGVLFPGGTVDREPGSPATRSECPKTRPCPWVACKYHLYGDVNETGSYIIYRPNIPVWDMVETCALDMCVDSDGMTLEEIGQIFNCTRERIRQIQKIALGKIRDEVDMGRLKEYLDTDK